MRKKSVVFIFTLFFVISLSAQENESVDTSAFVNKITKYDSSKERDMADVYFSLVRKKKDFTEKREEDDHKLHFSFVPALGYTLQTGFAGILSANWGFYNSKAADQKISSVSTSFTYSQYNQSIVPLVANIWTKGNKINFISDNRFIAYPSDIYGLGGRRISVDSNSDIGYTVDFSGLKLHETVMFEIGKDMFAGVGFYYDRFWNIKAIDSLKQNVVRLINRDLGTNELATGLAFRFLYDNRLNQIYPEQGWHFDITYRDNFNFLGSDKNWQTIQADVRTYFHFPEGSKNILAFWNFDWFTTNTNPPPYLMMPSTGWDDQYNTGRGYIQGRFRGYNMFYLESEYRFCITNNGLLGGVVFGNMQYFTPELSAQYNQLLPGYGLGLRLRLNKHSGANLCLDYGFGQNGSRGFFVNLGEVF